MSLADQLLKAAARGGKKKKKRRSSKRRRRRAAPRETQGRQAEQARVPRSHGCRARTRRAPASLNEGKKGL